MFGSSNGAQPSPAQFSTAADAALICGKYVQVFVQGPSTVDLIVFVNGVAVSTGLLESISVDIETPSKVRPTGLATGILALKQSGAADAAQSTIPLFPGTVEIISHRRRITITGSQDGSLDGLWLGLGLRPDGTSNELSGVHSLKIIVSPGIAGAQIVWSDTGVSEEILPVA